MKKAIIGLSVLAVGALAYYIYYLKTQATLIGQYCFNFISHNVVKLGLNETVVDLYLEVKNKSVIDVIITSYDFNVSINGHPISRLVSNQPQSLKGLGKSVITLRVAFSPKVVIKTAFSKDILLSALSLDKSKLIIGVDGVVSIKGVNAISFDNLPVSFDMPLSEMMPSSDTNIKEQC